MLLVQAKEAALLHAAVGAGIGGCCVLRLVLQWVQAKDTALLLAVVGAGEGGCGAAHLLSVCCGGCKQRW
jgi:hypothetical protein